MECLLVSLIVNICCDINCTWFNKKRINEFNWLTNTDFSPLRYCNPVNKQYFPWKHILTKSILIHIGIILCYDIQLQYNIEMSYTKTINDSYKPNYSANYIWILHQIWPSRQS